METRSVDITGGGVECDRCNGKGYIIVDILSAWDDVAMQCPECNGNGLSDAPPDPITVLSHAANYCYDQKWLCRYRGDHSGAESYARAEGILRATLVDLIDAIYHFNT